MSNCTCEDCTARRQAREEQRPATDDVVGFPRREIANALDILDRYEAPEVEFIVRVVRAVLATQ